MRPTAQSIFGEVIRGMCFERLGGVTPLLLWWSSATQHQKDDSNRIGFRGGEGRLVCTACHVAESGIVGQWDGGTVGWWESAHCQVRIGKGCKRKGEER